MVFWIIVILLAFHIVLAFFMSPPTALANKFFDKFATHPKLRVQDVSRISVNDRELSQEEFPQFVETFNEANFLYSGGIIQHLSEHPMMVQITQGKTTYVLKIYLYGDQMIQVIRFKNKRMNKYSPYRLNSSHLEQLLDRYRAS